jgi:hypothetical protein
MKLKATAAALVLAALPTMGMAECSWMKSSPSSTASTCPEGQTYDATSGTCVTQATS